jgi:hypothetical protein
MGLAEAAILLELELVGSILLVFLGRVISTLTLPAGENHFITHRFIST